MLIAGTEKLQFELPFKGLAKVPAVEFILLLFFLNIVLVLVFIAFAPSAPSTDLDKDCVFCIFIAVPSKRLPIIVYRTAASFAVILE